MKAIDYIKLEKQLDLCKDVLDNVKFSHKRIEQAKQWNQTDVSKWLHSEDKRKWRVQKQIKANEWWQRKMLREVNKLREMLGLDMFKNLNTKLITHLKNSTQWQQSHKL